jgi:hypothetical protein
MPASDEILSALIYRFHADDFGDFIADGLGDTGSERHGGHGAVFAHTEPPDSHAQVVGDFHQFDIAAVHIQVRANSIQGFFDPIYHALLFYGHGFL